jgi:hypothetical protein
MYKLTFVPGRTADDSNILHILQGPFIEVHDGKSLLLNVFEFVKKEVLNYIGEVEYDGWENMSLFGVHQAVPEAKMGLNLMEYASVFSDDIKDQLYRMRANTNSIRPVENIAGDPIDQVELNVRRRAHVYIPFDFQRDLNMIGNEMPAHYRIPVMEFVNYLLVFKSPTTIVKIPEIERFDYVPYSFYDTTTLSYMRNPYSNRIIGAQMMDKIKARTSSIQLFSLDQARTQMQVDKALRNNAAVDSETKAISGLISNKAGEEALLDMYAAHAAGKYGFLELKIGSMEVSIGTLTACIMSHMLPRKLFSRETVNLIDNVILVNMFLPRTDGTERFKELRRETDRVFEESPSSFISGLDNHLQPFLVRVLALNDPAFTALAEYFSRWADENDRARRIPAEARRFVSRNIGDVLDYVPFFRMQEAEGGSAQLTRFRLATRNNGMRYQRLGQDTTKFASILSDFGRSDSLFSIGAAFNRISYNVCLNTLSFPLSNEEYNGLVDFPSTPITASGLVSAMLQFDHRATLFAPELKYAVESANIGMNFYQCALYSALYNRLNEMGFIEYGIHFWRRSELNKLAANSVTNPTDLFIAWRETLDTPALPSFIPALNFQDDDFHRMFWMLYNGVRNNRALHGIVQSYVANYSQIIPETWNEGGILYSTVMTAPPPETAELVSFEQLQRLMYGGFSDFIRQSVADGRNIIFAIPGNVKMVWSYDEYEAASVLQNDPPFEINMGDGDVAIRSKPIIAAFVRTGTNYAINRDYLFKLQFVRFGTIVIPFMIWSRELFEACQILFDFRKVGSRRAITSFEFHPAGGV